MTVLRASLRFQVGLHDQFCGALRASDMTHTDLAIHRADAEHMLVSVHGQIDVSHVRCSERTIAVCQCKGSGNVCISSPACAWSSWWASALMVHPICDSIYDITLQGQQALYLIQFWLTGPCHNVLHANCVELILGTEAPVMMLNSVDFSLLPMYAVLLTGLHLLFRGR